MTKRQVWQYRCEFCKKKTYTISSMRTHETHCTANPSRVCRMHKHFDDPQPTIPVLLDAIKANAPIEKRIKMVRELASNCPMCILAAIRQSGICRWDGDPEFIAPETGFDFKKEIKAFWNVIDEENAC